MIILGPYLVWLLLHALVCCFISTYYYLQCISVFMHITFYIRSGMIMYTFHVWELYNEMHYNP